MSAEQGPLRMVVVGDSTCFVDETGPQMPGHPGVWPTMLAAILEAELERPVEPHVVARPGMTVHDAWSIVSKDQHVKFELLMGADLVVLSVGSFDHAPFGIPPAISAMVPYLRGDAVRRRVREALHDLYPLVVTATRGRWTRTAPATFDRLYDQVLVQLRGLARTAAMAAVGPTSHRSAYYGKDHPRHADRSRSQGELALGHGIPFVPSWPLVVPFADQLNVDGIHWPRPAHEAVAEALAAVLLPQLRGQNPTPGPPGPPSLPASH